MRSLDCCSAWLRMRLTSHRTSSGKHLGIGRLTRLRNSLLPARKRIWLLFQYRNPVSPLQFAKTEHVAVSILDNKLDACPWLLFKRSDHVSATLFQLGEQIAHARDGDVRVQMLVLFAVFPIGARFRSTLEMDRESVPADARIE